MDQPAAPTSGPDSAPDYTPQVGDRVRIFTSDPEMGQHRKPFHGGAVLTIVAFDPDRSDGVGGQGLGAYTVGESADLRYFEVRNERWGYTREFERVHPGTPTPETPRWAEPDVPPPVSEIVRHWVATDGYVGHSRGRVTVAEHLAAYGYRVTYTGPPPNVTTHSCDNCMGVDPASCINVPGLAPAEPATTDRD